MTTRDYDQLNRLLQIESRKDANVLTSFAYTLNATGMRTSVTEQDGRKVDYKYDNLYRLTEEKITDAVNENKTIGFVMDAVGNRTSKTDSVGGTTSYVYDANDRLLTETSGAQTTTYTYDNNGNTKTKTNGTGVTLYTWNDEGRLVEVENPNGEEISYEYNENGIRVSSTTNGVKASFLTDSNRDYAQVLEESTNSGLQVAYVYGTDLISQNRNGDKSFYIYEGLGTIKALTNSSGVVTDRYLYDAYGNLISLSGSTTNKYLYTGEQFDSNLGQYYLRDRFYNQNVGRFTRSDVFEGEIFDPLTLHKYFYASSSPVNNADPSGLSTLGEVLTTVSLAAIHAASRLPSYLPVITKALEISAYILSIGLIAANIDPGAGGNGKASEFGDLDGKSKGEIDKLLKDAGAELTGSGNNYRTYKFKDGSKIDVQLSTGRLTRTPGRKIGSDGQNQNKGKRLNKDGSIRETKHPDGTPILGAHDSDEHLKCP